MDNYLLDTNSIIYALNGGFKFPKYNYFISIVTEIELLSYSKLTQNEEYLLKQALSNFDNINLTNDIKNKTIELRRNSKLKLSDSIIVATAIIQNATLITSDKKMLGIDLLNMIELKDLK